MDNNNDCLKKIHPSHACLDFSRIEYQITKEGFLKKNGTPKLQCYTDIDYAKSLTDGRSTSK